MILSRPNNNSLSRFLCKTAERYPNLALKAYWTFFGYANEYAPQKNNNTWAEKMLESIEMHVINGCRTNEKSASLLFFSERIYSSEYTSLQNSFVENLTQAAIQLKDFDQTLRKSKLETFLAEMNQWIEEKLREKEIDKKSKYNSYYKGVVLPLEVGDDKDPTLIVNIITELAHCYNTRMRSPYKIVFETIKLSEASQWNDKMAIETHVNESFDKISMKFSLHTEMKDSKKLILKQLYNPEIPHKEELKHLINKRQRPILSNKSSKTELLVTHKRRTHSDGDADSIAKLKSDYEMIKRITRKYLEVDLRNILEKYGKKAAPKEDIGYIPLEKRLEDMEDPFGESWETTMEKQRKKSAYGVFETYIMRAYIVKGNDDLRQELMAMQFMKRMQEIYNKAGIQIFLRPYEVIITSHNSGLIGTC